ncbi:MAG: erythromycin esterase family protein [Fibrobacteres bacterium]|nr:erythromycin esterase family protein [Fibrobacterota bacterium]
MPASVSHALQDALALISAPIEGRPSDYDPLIESIGEARFVLLGEASHGTREFYSQRAAITKRLIREKGFTAVAVEADWPDAFRVNRFVRGEGDPLSGADPLEGFRRFPEWMWRNSEVLDFILWLRQWNDSLGPGRPKTGFYGLDLYSLYASMEAVLAYLDRIDPEAAARARERYACLGIDANRIEAYGMNAALGLSPSCETEVIDQLLELRRRGEALAASAPDGDELFQAEQNARLIVNAEQYYRTMLQGHVASWNLRDKHMADTLDALAFHLESRTGIPSKIAVWEHNSHLGDARATQFRRHGELNVGQLARERYGSQAYLVGFTTFSGTVRAAADWGEPGSEKRVRPGLPGSYEALLHGTGMEKFFLDLRLEHTAIRDLGEPRLERAIGVVYRPENERSNHYFEARLPAQFDAVIHFDETHAVDTLGPPRDGPDREPPETYPDAV